MAIVAEGDRQRVYLPPDPEHVKAADVPRPSDVPDTEIPYNARYLTAPNYGMTHHADLFTNRQLTALCTFSDLVMQARNRVVADGGQNEYADVVATYLALALSRMSEYASTITTWASNPQMEILRGTFARQALPMTWDFAEGNVFGPSSGSLDMFLASISKVLEHLAPGAPAIATSARGISYAQLSL